MERTISQAGRIGIVGLGTIGTQEMALWRRAGYPTVGYDTSERRLAGLRTVSTDGPGPQSVLTGQITDLAGCTVLVLCLPNLSGAGHLSMEAFERFVESMQELEPNDRLIVLASTVPIGFSRRLASQLGAHGGLLAHVPERFDPGRGTDLGEIPRVVGATTERARDLTTALYATTGVATHPVEPVEVAEASKLLENAFRLVNIAFINEFAELCRRLGIATSDVVDAAATKPFAFMAHYPGAGAGGSCIPTMPKYLVQAAELNQLSLPILEAALEGNDHVGERIANHLRTLMVASGSGRGRVLVVGAAYKPDYPDARGSSALRLAMTLQQQYEVVVYDPIVDERVLPRNLELRREVPKERFDAVVIALRHRGTDVAALHRLAPVFLDLVRGDMQVAQAGLSQR